MYMGNTDAISVIFLFSKERKCSPVHTAIMMFAMLVTQRFLEQITNTMKWLINGFGQFAKRQKIFLLR